MDTARVFPFCVTGETTKEAAVEGSMITPDGKTYSFCDIYRFNGIKNARIKEMKS